MAILHLYQLALILTIVGTVAAANWARRQKAIASGPLSHRPLANLTSAVTESVKDQIHALDKLFDENLISVEEYVELRKRALG